jgi:hypothetical protein
MMPATPFFPLRPLMVTNLPRLARFLARPQLPTRAYPLPVGRDIPQACPICIHSSHVP